MSYLTTLLAVSMLMLSASASPLKDYDFSNYWKMPTPPGRGTPPGHANPSGLALPPGLAKIFQTKLDVPISGPAALAGVYAKYKVRMTQRQYIAAINLSGAKYQATVSANPEYFDAAYLSPVTIGGQTLNLDFDTGSSDLWVFSTNLPASVQAGHDVYDPKKSNTSVAIPGATWSITYADGTGARGNVYNDTVTVGGLKIPNQAVELASSLSDEFVSDTDRDGTFGLAFPNINTITPKQRTDFMFTAVQQKALQQNVFTADLKKGKPGSYDFGFINSTKYTGSITYTNVDSSQGFWSFTFTGYGVGSNYTTTQMTGVADTGTSIVFLPDAIVNAYWAKVPGASYDDNYGAFTFPCSATLPSFTIGVGSTKFVLPGTYLNYGPLSQTSKSTPSPKIIHRLICCSMLWWSAIEHTYWYQYLRRCFPQGFLRCV